MKNELNEVILKLYEIKKSNPTRFEKLKHKLFELKNN